VAIHSDDIRGLEMGHRFGRGGTTPLPAPDIRLKDGDELDAGSMRFTIIHTPGHTQGGICLLSGKVLFSGDTLFNSSIGRSDMPGGNGPQLIQSIFTRLLTLPDDTLVLPGHGPETTIGAERRTNPFLRS
jgi:glyoxylase-like metal-dependent hydrolase (beta-lactamase superfamily II)